MKIWIGIILAIVVIGGGALWWQQNSQTSIDEQTSTTNTTNSSSKENTKVPVSKTEPIKTTTVTSNGFSVGFFNPDVTTPDFQPNSILSLGNKNSQNEGVDLTGWRIESKSTGLSYVIPKVTISIGYKGSQPATIPPKDVSLWPYDGLSITLMGTADDDYIHQTEATSYGLYTGKTTWNTSHDTITIKDANGTVLGQLTY